MRLLPFLAFLLAARFASAAANAPYPFSFDEVTVAPGVIAFVEKPGHAIVSGNSVAIIGTEAVAVVDTGHHPRLTRSVIERIRALTPKPVQYVINTHWHNDHVSGNALYAEAFPGVKFVAHEFTARMLDQEIVPYMGEGCVRFLQKQTAPLRETVASGRDGEGKPVADARIARLREVLADADAAARECGEFRFRGSDIAFTDRVTLRLGGRAVDVLFLGRANTAGDALVHVPDARVLVTGDVVVYPFPFATQSYIGEWARVLRRIEAMDVDAIVPGHGPVMRDKSYVRLLGDLMASVDAQARSAWRPGMPLEEMRAKVDVAGLRQRFAGDDAFIAANFDAAARSAVERAWQEMQGRLEPEGLPRG